MQKIINKLSLHPKRVFLIDSFGAFLSAILLLVILSKFHEIFGMPYHILVSLSIIALIYVIYSIGCFFLIDNNWRPFLKAISIANLLYCCLTAGLVIIFFQRLTNLGIIYFLIEILLISGLIIIEHSVLNDRLGKS